jgi:hypothetical protein
MLPNSQLRILEERPLETPTEIQALEQVSAELKSHMKQELIDHFSGMLQKQYGITPKQQSCMYRTPYPFGYDQIPFSPIFKVPDFTKFSGQDETSTMEHITRFIIQCGQVGNIDSLRIRLFSSSLSGPAFSWFTSLPANSIIKWSDLEQQFHNYFFSSIHEMKITDLTRLKTRNDEIVAGFVQRFKQVRNKFYSLNLGDKQLAELAFQGLLPTLREKYASHDFESLSQLVSRMSQEITKSYEPRKNFHKKVSYVDYSDSEDEDNLIGLTEWVKGKKKVSCPFGKKELGKFCFDITKADKIFDLLLQQGQIKLSQFHTIPSVEELKRMKYCKWHNATSHDTNDCKIFRQWIQSAIEQGRLKFEIPTKAEKPMKIDQHPFPTNIVEVSSKDTSRVKLLTSDSAQNK